MKEINLAIFASGTGSNAVRLIEHFKDHPRVKIKLVLSNKLDAKVIESARQRGVESVFKDNSFVANGELLNQLMQDHQIHWIILAGYLRLIPSELTIAFPNRIINLHPALLPKFGGKGMFGNHVHEAVIANKEKESGISIHFVNEHFDEGNLIAQFHCPVLPTDTPESLFSKIQYLEHSFFPIVVERTILNPAYV
jgi:phosphoribosylglycinamide formyltransferase 1